MNIQKALTDVGLTGSEADVYLALIELGPAPVAQIAQKAGITRQMAYNLLPKLQQKGLAVENYTRGKKRYQSTKLQSLRDYSDQVANNVKAIIPELKTLQAELSAIPTIKIYENPVSMREWYREFVKTSQPDDELLLWVTNKVWIDTDSSFLKSFIAFKNKHQMRDKIIAPDTTESREFAKEVDQPFAEYRFMRQPWKSDTEKWIWRDTISLLTIRGNLTNLIVIRSAALAELERAAFYATWKTLI